VLSHFSGARPLLLEVTARPDGTLSLRQNGQVELEAARADAPAAAAIGVPTDPALHTRMKDPTERFRFSFPDLQGRIVSDTDAAFRDKVLLVNISGSWCPNCHDEAMFLVPFYKEYQPKGVEIIALMFERHGEFERAAQAVRGYRKDLGIQFTTLIAGLSETDEASKALPTLTGVYGYPTTLIIDRNGVVRDTHVGFSGPATGHHYEEYVTEFRALVDQLLSQAPGP
jgi:thiol-disulfide isomerase/thioredoxin